FEPPLPFLGVDSPQPLISALRFRDTRDAAQRCSTKQNRGFETHSLPNSLAATLAVLPSMSMVPSAPLKLARCPTHSPLPSRLCLLCCWSRQLHSLFRADAAKRQS